MRLDRVKDDFSDGKEVRRRFRVISGVVVHKMRWLGRPEVDSYNPNESRGYRSMVIYLDTLEQSKKLINNGEVEAPNGELAFVKEWIVGRSPARCYRCHQYGHLHYRCRAPTAICGQCSLPGHSASACTSKDFKCAACKGPHKASDGGCPVYRRELQKVRPSKLV